MLLLRTELTPIRIPHGKGTRLALINHMLGMNHWKRKSIHDEMVGAYTELLKGVYSQHPFAHSKADTYQVSLGYMIGTNASGRKTGTVDCDGFGIIMKYATDALIKATPIPTDSCHVITESRIRFLGASPDGEEHLYLQVVKNGMD